ncbi:L-aspartate oxidase [Fodinibius saliphilus]|uniref:L-aspartate oxidase n=1 Tax=Fodinibius saliphilus TaxID=1920650 RepID=UPI0011090179|nr:L-aspartate oxidase [Fodinibius saliphilus]
MNSYTSKTDFLIIGSGAAGLHAAWHASQYGNVTLITKSSLEASSSYWAQGGIAAVLNDEDSYQSHKEDTLEAGRGTCNPQAVDILVQEGAKRVQEIIDLGMPFDTENGNIELGLEGGHSNRRVLHANGAATGKALVEFFTELVKQQANIEIVEHAFAYELCTRNSQCLGAKAYLYKQDQLLTIESPVTILATGGYSGLYQRSTNPHTSTGDGLWLGYNAGTSLRDLEFVQFHPTAFYAGDGSTFLISEAVRGEGARLYNKSGERFMASYPQQELAPRDVVSQEILKQIQAQESDYVYLDVRHLDIGELGTHFPTLIQRIEEQGIDLCTEGIPVAPAAHYCIGGIATDLHARTSVGGLFACGEVAATGIHGANRLASNSLLECLVFSKRAVETSQDSDITIGDKGTLSSKFEIEDKNKELFTALQQNVAGLLSNYVGIERSREGLKEALDQLKVFENQLLENDKEYYSLRSKGMIKLAQLISRSALEREESRGVHTRSDFPAMQSSSSPIRYQKENMKSLSV